MNIRSNRKFSNIKLDIRERLITDRAFEISKNIMKLSNPTRHQYRFRKYHMTVVNDIGLYLLKREQNLDNTQCTIFSIACLVHDAYKYKDDRLHASLAVDLFYDIINTIPDKYTNGYDEFITECVNGIKYHSNKEQWNLSVKYSAVARCLIIADVLSKLDRKSIILAYFIDHKSSKAPNKNFIAEVYNKKYKEAMDYIINHQKFFKSRINIDDIFYPCRKEESR